MYSAKSRAGLSALAHCVQQDGGRYEVSQGQAAEALGLSYQFGGPGGRIYVGQYLTSLVRYILKARAG